MATGVDVPPLPRVAANATVEANTADGTLAASNFGKIQTNTGATAQIALTLPGASGVGGLPIRVQLTAGLPVKVVPASGEKIFLGGSGVASKFLLIAGQIGNFADIVSDGVQYHVTLQNGNLTKEA